MTKTFRMTMAQAIRIAEQLGFPYAVQDWSNGNGPDFVVAHGAGDGIGKTVYATIKGSQSAQSIDKL